MKKILLVATGGTIASLEDEQGALTPGLTGEELAHHVPELRDLCDFDVQQVMNIDSTNMRPADWMRIRDAIVGAYDDYDGFVVLHGTDTMAYTAAALSYLIQGSPKPIVLTGSQQPMANPFTDARLNVYQSVLYACDDMATDVRIVFGGAVIAGTRARKQRTMSADAFASVNFPEIAVVRGGRVMRAGVQSVLSLADMLEAGSVNAGAVAPHASAASAAGEVAGNGATASGVRDAIAAGHGVPFGHSLARLGRPRVYDRLNDRVCVLKLTPGMNPAMLDALKRDYDALIVETFGIGGIPDYGDFQHAIFDWVDSGRALVVTTQVPEEGCDLGVYEVGRTYADHEGILKGGDMTTEALVAKTMWALGQAESPAELRELFYRVINYDRAMEA